MAVELILRNGTAAENDGFTGASAEVTVDKTNNTLRLHDGVTPGGTSIVTATTTDTLENKTLSSPEFTGQITGDLIPSDDITYDLGSSSNRWRDLFLSGNTIDIGGATISVTSGSFEFKDSGGNDAEVSLAANTTDDLSEGSSNLYYTDSRVRNALSVSGDLSYDSASGTFSFTERTDAEVLSLFSGSTGIDYNSSTGSITLADTTVVAGTFGSASEVPVITIDGQGRITDASTTTVAGVSDFTYDNTTGVLDIDTADGSTFSATVELGPFTTDDLSEGSTNLYYTDARVDSHLSGGTGVSYSSGTISIGQSVGTTDNVTFNDVTISGDLTVTGTTTSLNTTTLDVEDINITVANGASNAGAADGAGLTADLGSNGSATFTYDSANDRWVMNKSLNTDLIGNVTGTVSDISNHDTDDLSEGTTNLYYTDTRTRNALSASGDLSYSSSTGEFSVTTYKSSDFDTDFFAKDTDDLSEGTSSLYFTESRARDALSADGDLSYDSSTGTFSFTERTDSEVRELLSASGDLSYDSATGEFFVTTYKSSDFDSDFSGKDTDELSEGTGNLYHTDSRVRGAVSASGDLSYDSDTGEFSFTERTDAEVRNLFSAAGDLSYDNATGEFSVTTYKSADFDTDFSNKDTDDLSEGTTNLYYLDSRVDSHLSGGTGVSYSSGTISIGQAVGTTDNVTFNDVVVNGDLTVSGTTTTINTETIELADNNIVLNSNFTGSSPTENGGITINRGTLTDAVLQWNETNDYWEIASGGTVGRILTEGDDTDDLSEGLTNFYFTTARVDAHLSGGNGIDYNSGTISVSNDSIGTDELNVSGTGSAGQALLSDGDGSFSFGPAGATISNDGVTDSNFYPTLSDSTSGVLNTATVSSDKLFFNPSSGTLNATSFNSLSDKRSKKNIETLDGALDKTLALRGVSYTFKGTDVDSIGLIAQELEEVIPEVVSTGDDGLKSVSYGNIVGLLVEAIKEQQKQIDDLKNKMYK